MHVLYPLQNVIVHKVLIIVRIPIFIVWLTTLRQRNDKLQPTQQLKLGLLRFSTEIKFYYRK